MPALSLTVEVEEWPLAQPFVIARGSKSVARVVVVTLSRGGKVGFGESVPYGRYGETIESVVAQIETIRGELAHGLKRANLQKLMPAGAARNAVDCALWDIEAKEASRSVAEMLGITVPERICSVQTLSIGSPKAMQAEAVRYAEYPIIKIKLDSHDVLARMEAVRRGAPNARFIIDANESWTLDLLKDTAPALAGLNVVMIEQPLRADEDEALESYSGPIPIGADESCHTSEGLEALKTKYDYINIKLDKTGGLTEALALKAAAKETGFGIMIGSMVSTSLALAPAVLLAGDADFVDLDSPNLLANDRPAGLDLKKGWLSKFGVSLWGGV
ncbi:MAG: L-Ala-D/L-Glu epimerase [Kordiimonadales bacterium]|nr:MAG: L-Ala-D/L-Glu epimerase [Kordiimonadales bacterium]